MATSATPALIDALVVACTTALPSAVVTDGKGVTNNPGNYLMIGVDDPDAQDHTEASDARLSWAGLGNHARDQEGDLWLVAASVDGGGNQKTARDAAYAVMAAVETIARTDPTISGVITTGWTFVSSERLQQAQSKGGARARIAFQLHYKTRL